ncbi:hypothetical protein MTO96_039489 [Rhipicephalus appendiculatus]
MRQSRFLVVNIETGLCHCVEAPALRSGRGDQSSGFSRGFPGIPRTAAFRRSTSPIVLRHQSPVLCGARHCGSSSPFPT